tara:strand:- start:107 stop:313 length:207 start_codon:yes stop_codon:yes gene_type:complete
MMTIEAEKLKNMMKDYINLECFMEDLDKGYQLYKKNEFDADAPTPSHNRLMLRELCKKMIATIDSIDS